jgi:hypothetical protein
MVSVWLCALVCLLGVPVSRDVDDRVRHSKGCAGEVISCKAAYRRGVKIFCEVVGGTHHDCGVLANIEDEVIAVGGWRIVRDLKIEKISNLNLFVTTAISRLIGEKASRSRSDDPEDY